MEELIARVRRAGATGGADGGFWSHDLIDTLGRLNVGWSITVRINKTIRACIEAIDPDAWVPIGYPDSGEAAVAETTYRTGRGRKRRSHRLVARRSRLVDPAQQALWPDWRYHAFMTSSVADAVTADRFHRDHANVELAIRDLRQGAGMQHCPSGRFFANAAWLACAVLAHNIVRWTVALGGIRHSDELTIAATLRTQLIAAPARLVDHAGTPLARPAQLALGRALHPGSHQTARPTTRSHLDGTGGRHRSRTPSADNPTSHEQPAQRALAPPRGSDRDLSRPHPPPPTAPRSRSVDRG